MRKLDGDTKKIIELYKYNNEKQIRDLMLKRKNEIRNEIDIFVENQKRNLFFDNVINNINEKYKGNITIKYYFEISNYESNFDLIYDEDATLRGLKDSLEEIRNERKNITLALQFADSKSKEYKEALKKLERGCWYGFNKWGIKSY